MYIIKMFKWDHAYLSYDSLEGVPFPSYILILAKVSLSVIRFMQLLIRCQLQLSKNISVKFLMGLLIYFNLFLKQMALIFFNSNLLIALPF